MKKKRLVSKTAPVPNTSNNSFPLSTNVQNNNNDQPLRLNLNNNPTPRPNNPPNPSNAIANVDDDDLKKSKKHFKQIQKDPSKAVLKLGSFTPIPTNAPSSFGDPTGKTPNNTKAIGLSGKPFTMATSLLNPMEIPPTNTATPMKAQTAPVSLNPDDNVEQVFEDQFNKIKTSDNNFLGLSTTFGKVTNRPITSASNSTSSNTFQLARNDSSGAASNQLMVVQPPQQAQELVDANMEVEETYSIAPVHQTSKKVQLQRERAKLLVAPPRPLKKSKSNTQQNNGTLPTRSSHTQRLLAKARARRSRSPQNLEIFLSQDDLNSSNSEFKQKDVRLNIEKLKM